jgi:hypothetical protein
VWSHLPVRNIIDKQRLAAVEAMGQRALALHEEGYPVDRDRVLDELSDRLRSWLEERGRAER